jgi:hypothetical protein
VPDVLDALVVLRYCSLLCTAVSVLVMRSCLSCVISAVQHRTAQVVTTSVRACLIPQEKSNSEVQVLLKYAQTHCTDAMSKICARYVQCCTVRCSSSVSTELEGIAAELYVLLNDSTYHTVALEACIVRCCSIY